MTRKHDDIMQIISSNHKSTDKLSTLKLAAHWPTRPDSTSWSWSYWVVSVSVHGLKIRPDISLSRVVRSEHVQLSRLAIESGFIMCDSKSAVISFKPIREN